MPLKINVGVYKKIGLFDYGSVGSRRRSLKGLDARRLNSISEREFGKTSQQLSGHDASKLIDMLKAARKTEGSRHDDVTRFPSRRRSSSIASGRGLMRISNASSISCESISIHRIAARTIIGPAGAV